MRYSPFFCLFFATLFSSVFCGGFSHISAPFTFVLPQVQYIANLHMRPWVFRACSSLTKKSNLRFLKLSLPSVSKYSLPGIRCAHSGYVHVKGLQIYFPHPQIATLVLLISSVPCHLQCHPCSGQWCPAVKTPPGSHANNISQSSC